jgi:putative Ca2+/H+ antiporter (TMEM165/GDT1 family)
MASFIKALLLVVVAEIGDKTQLLVMVSKCKAKQVSIGVLIDTWVVGIIFMFFGTLTRET